MSYNSLGKRSLRLFTVSTKVLCRLKYSTPSTRCAFEPSWGLYRATCCEPGWPFGTPSTLASFNASSVFGEGIVTEHGEGRNFHRGKVNIDTYTHPAS